MTLPAPCPRAGLPRARRGVADRAPRRRGAAGTPTRGAGAGDLVGAGGVRSGWARATSAGAGHETGRRAGQRGAPCADGLRQEAATGTARPSSRDRLRPSTSSARLCSSPPKLSEWTSLRGSRLRSKPSTCGRSGQRRAALTRSSRSPTAGSSPSPERATVARPSTSQAAALTPTTVGAARTGRWSGRAGRLLPTRGTPVLTVGAGAMSRPILERLGFSIVGWADNLLDEFG